MCAIGVVPHSHCPPIVGSSWSLIRTFHPEFLDVRLNAGRFESDAEGGEDEEADKEDLAGVPLDESSQVVQMPLKFGP